MTADNGSRNYRAFMLIVTTAMGLAWGGLNRDASLYVDADYRTVPIDSLGTAAYGKPFWIGIRIADARYLDTFGFRLGFDSSLVEFVKAVPASPTDGIADFLESKGGTSVGFLGRISSQDSTQVTVANGLTGQDSSKAPSGSGLLVLMEFISKGSVPGKAAFAISEVKLLDWQQNLDSLVSTHAGAVMLQPTEALVQVNRNRRATVSPMEAIALAISRSPSRAGFYLLGRRN